MKTTAIITALLVSATFTFAGDKSKKADAGKHDAAAMLTQLDSNKDGSVSKEEFLASKRAQKDADKAQKHFDHLDANKDGKISKEEFAAMPEHGKKAEATTPTPAAKPEEKKAEEKKPEEKK